MSKNRIQIVIKTGMHGRHKYSISQIKELLEEFLTKAGMKGEFQVTVGARRKGRNHMKKIHVVEENGSSVRLKVKPGDNNTCCELYLIVPEKFNGKSDAFLDLLQKTAQEIN